LNNSKGNSNLPSPQFNTPIIQVDNNINTIVDQVINNNTIQEEEELNKMEMNKNKEQDKFKEDEYKEVLIAINIIVEKIDCRIENYNDDENIDFSPKQFVSVLNENDLYDAIKKETVKSKSNIKNNNFLTAIEILKIGYYYSFLKMEAFEKNQPYIQYIKDKVSDTSDNTIQQYIKFYGVFCKIKPIVLLIKNENYCASKIYKKIGALQFLEVAEFNGEKIQLIASKKLPDKLLSLFPPTDTPFKDAWKEKKETKKSKDKRKNNTNNKSKIKKRKDK
jgi:hypothetical protein